MAGPRRNAILIRRIYLDNILSFGPVAQEVDLAPLNVLIGPNGSGKSNFLEVIGLLQAAPNDIMASLRAGGGGHNWIWRGEQPSKEARVEIDLASSRNSSLRYSLAITPHDSGEIGFREEIEETESTEEGQGISERYLKRRNDELALIYRNESREKTQREMLVLGVDPDESILSQHEDLIQYDEIMVARFLLSGMRLYRDWSFGHRNSGLRLPRGADLPDGSLLEGGLNLGMVLKRLEGDSNSKRRLLSELRKLYHGIDDYYVRIEAGRAQIFLKEGNVSFPAARLSDGTLRYLCMLAVLCHPNPPILVCIEQPELGLHPDVMPCVADLLRKASERCQLIVTTHSDMLVDALTETPESIVICEKENGQTKLRRLNSNDLSHWLEKYRLGELWNSGELGGTRW